MRSKPFYDHGLVDRAIKFSSGAHVHQCNNVLTPYNVWHEIYDLLPANAEADMDAAIDQILKAEQALRNFVHKVVMESIPAWDSLKMADFAPAMAA